MGRRSLMTHRSRNLIRAVILIMIVSSTVSNAVQFKVRLKADEPLITIVAVMLLFFYLITFFAYFKVYRIIRKHQQQIKKKPIFSKLWTTGNKLATAITSLLCIFTLFSVTLFPRRCRCGCFFFRREGIFLA